ncbi:MAG: calcium-binding protein, partial [Alphaproteobacteria bacterium]
AFSPDPIAPTGDDNDARSVGLAATPHEPTTGAAEAVAPMATASSEVNLLGRAVASDFRDDRVEQAPGDGNGGSVNATETVAGKEPDHDHDEMGPGSDDTVNGGPGNSDDTLYGGAGNDTLNGDNGDDILYGGSGNDILNGGNHDDTLYGGSGNDNLDGGNHHDTLYGGSGDDTLDGGAQEDMLYGGDGDDTLRGGSQNDTLDGGDGADTLYGGQGADTLQAGAGNNTLYGEQGDDLFIFDNTGINGTNWVDGGEGNDTLDLTGCSAGWTVILDNGDRFSHYDAPDASLFTDDAGVLHMDGYDGTITFDDIETFTW